MLKILLILANVTISLVSCSSQMNTVRSCLSPHHTLCLVALLISLPPLRLLFKLRGLLPSFSLFFSLFPSLCGVGMNWGLHTSVPTHSAGSLAHALFCLVSRPDLSLQFRLAPTPGPFCLYHVSGAKIRSMHYHIQDRDFPKSTSR